jgi:hypothetical protein
VIDNFEIETGEVFGLMSLMAVEKLGCHEVFQVLMIAKDLDWV